MRPRRTIAAIALVVSTSWWAACGRGAPSRGKDGGPADDAAAEAPPIPVPVRALGKGALDEFGWRAGPGKAAFGRALAAERGGDLPLIEREAAAALAADPGHLEAAWVAAVARARLGQHDRVVPALEIAAAGDWPKWGERSLELGALAAFRASPAGRGWVAAAEGYRGALAAALARAVLVIGKSPAGGRLASELYAVDLVEARWIRLTRTGGTVAGALPAGAALVAYVAHRPAARGVLAQVKVGVVELATGRAGREVAIGDVRDLTLAWRERGGELELEAAWTPAAGKKQAATIDWRHGRRTPLDKPRPMRGARLAVDARGAALRRLPIAGVTADWDERATASAIRLDRSGKVVASPDGALVDGDTVELSPDQARLVFASAAEPPCAPGDPRRLYVAEVATGRVRKLAEGAVGSARWLDADRVAFVDGDAVTVAAAATGKAIATVRGGASVTTTAIAPPRRCDPEDEPFVDVPVVTEPEEPELPDDWAEPDAGPADAAVD